MSQAQLAPGPDRLPWLSDDDRVARSSQARGRTDRVRAAGGRIIGTAAAMAAIAASSFWIGAHGWLGRQANAPQQQSQQQPQHSTTVSLPSASPAITAPPRVTPEPLGAVAPVAQPVVHPTEQREVRIARPAPVAERRTRALAETALAETGLAETGPSSRIAPAPGARSLPITQSVPITRFARNVAVARIASPAPAGQVTRQGPLPLWPARISAGAYGRLVQIGAFGTRLQAKRGWRAMVVAYPAVSHLPAVVVESRNSRGLGFFRFQIGTTSQAHSEVLCQRMEKIRMSCAVVGLPWKPKGVER